MKEEKVFIIDYAYGFHADTCEVDYVCKLRCLAALRALKKFPDAYIVLGAGMKEVTGDCGPLAGMMEDFLDKHHIPKSKILRNPHGNDTLSETEAAYVIVQKHGGGKIICATSAYHAPRVWSIWLCRFGIVPMMYTTALKPSRLEYLHEIAKVPRDMIRALLYRFRYILSFVWKYKRT
jgi:uncharacterized SAM-binding protein YcdF (DUF218 family)